MAKTYADEDPRRNEAVPPEPSPGIETSRANWEATKAAAAPALRSVVGAVLPHLDTGGPAPAPAASVPAEAWKKTGAPMEERAAQAPWKPAQPHSAAAAAAAQPLSVGIAHKTVADMVKDYVSGILSPQPAAQPAVGPGQPAKPAAWDTGSLDAARSAAMSAVPGAMPAVPGGDARSAWATGMLEKYGTLMDSIQSRLATLQKDMDFNRPFSATAFMRGQGQDTSYQTPILAEMNALAHISQAMSQMMPGVMKDLYPEREIGVKQGELDVKRAALPAAIEKNLGEAEYDKALAGKTRKVTEALPGSFQESLALTSTAHPAKPQKEIGDAEKGILLEEYKSLNRALEMETDQKKIADITARKRAIAESVGVGRAQAKQPPVSGARQGSDGGWYVPDPKRPGKYLKFE